MADEMATVSPDVWERQRGRELRARVGLITEEELCAMLEVSKHTLQSWRVAGSGPKYVRFGRAIFYTELALTDWLEGHVRTSTANTSAKTLASDLAQSLAAGE
jgi:hypothetical protein